MVAMKGRLAQNGPREVAIENLHVNDNAVTAPVSVSNLQWQTVALEMGKLINEYFSWT